MSSVKQSREEIEQTLSSLLEEGVILGYELPHNFEEDILILVDQKDRSLEEKLKNLFPEVSLRIIETEPIKAL